MYLNTIYIGKLNELNLRGFPYYYNNHKHTCQPREHHPVLTTSRKTALGLESSQKLC